MVGAVRAERNTFGRASRERQRPEEEAPQALASSGRCALFSLTDMDLLRHITLGLALASGVGGVGGLLAGSALVVWETRQSLAILREEANFARDRLWRHT